MIMCKNTDYRYVVLIILSCPPPLTIKIKRQTTSNDVLPGTCKKSNLPIFTKKIR